MFFYLFTIFFFLFFFFFFNDTATTEIYTLSLHDALPAATPRTADSTGLSSEQIARISRLARSMVEASKVSGPPPMSAPALNAPPAPLSTTSRTSSRRRQPSNASVSRSIIPAVSALSASGRLSVSRRMPPSRRSSRSLNADPGLAHLGDGGRRGLRRDPRAQVGEQPGREAVADRVERGRAHAVVGGEAADVDVGDLVLAEPVGECVAGRRTPLEA